MKKTIFLIIFALVFSLSCEKTSQDEAKAGDRTSVQVPAETPKDASQEEMKVVTLKVEGMT